jgi:hypothetical protein
MISSISAQYNELNRVNQTSHPRRTIVEIVAKCLFLGLRNWHFASQLNFPALQWIILNQSFQFSVPFTWKIKLVIEPIVLDVLNSFPPSLKETIPYYVSEVGLNEKKVIKHFSQLIKNQGSCHGQCLALLEQALQHPDKNPNEFFNNLSCDLKRVYHFQVLEMMRGLFDKKIFLRNLFYEFQQNQLPEKEIKKISAKFDHQLWQSLETEWKKGSFQENKLHNQTIHQHVITYFPPATNTLALQFSSSNYETGYQKLHNLLLQEKNAAIIIRCWNNGKSISHTLLYYCSLEHGRYWFYNSQWIGLYQYPNSDCLINHFTNHLSTFFPYKLEKDATYLLDIYR